MFYSDLDFENGDLSPTACLCGANVVNLKTAYYILAKNDKPSVRISRNVPYITKNVTVDLAIQVS